MEIDTRRLGYAETLTVNDDAIIFFPAGLPGFAQHVRFALIDDESLAPLRWLQAVDDPWVVFAVVDPLHIGIPEYAFSVSDADADALQLSDASDALTLAVMTLAVHPHDCSINLVAPLVINTRRRLGRQIILDSGDFSLRYHPLATSTHNAPAAIPPTPSISLGDRA